MKKYAGLGGQLYNNKSLTQRDFNKPKPKV